MRDAKPVMQWMISGIFSEASSALAPGTHFPVLTFSCFWLLVQRSLLEPCLNRQGSGNNKMHVPGTRILRFG